MLSKKIASENSECCFFACEENGHKQNLLVSKKVNFYACRHKDNVIQMKNNTRHVSKLKIKIKLFVWNIIILVTCEFYFAF